MKLLYHTFEYFSNAIRPHCLRKWQPRLQFGVEVLSLQRIESLNANARVLERKRKTAETKIYRLVHTQYFDRLFPTILTQLQLVQAGDVVNIDFSDFQGRQVLMFAKQTGDGRALPVYFQFITYPIEKDSQNIFIIQTIQTFVQLIGVQTHLVFDRGFACPSIITFLNEHGIKFTIRIKKNKHVIPLNQTRSVAVQQLKKRSNRVTAYGQHLRIVRSKKDRRHTEPWYLVTNDFTTQADASIERYYHRFEIEELFKDTKHVSGMEHLHSMTDHTFTIVLWFVLLGYWMAWKVKAIRKTWYHSMHHKKHQLSLIRFWFEQLAHERYLMVKQNRRGSYG